MHKTTNDEVIMDSKTVKVRFLLLCKNVESFFIIIMSSWKVNCNTLTKSVNMKKIVWFTWHQSS